MTLKRLIVYLIVCAIAGSVAGEFMGAVLVRNSTKSLLKEQAWIEKNGYIGVPGTRLREEQSSSATYFKAGLFFSLSVGLAYGILWGILYIVSFTLLADAVCSISLRLKGRVSEELNGKERELNTQRVRNAFSFLFILLCGVVIFYVRSIGWRMLWPFGIFLFIIPIVCSLTGYYFFEVNSYYNYKNILIYFIGFVIFFSLTHFLFTSYLSARDFIRIRDQMLLKTHWGKKVDKFYYHYTLYAAEVIKSFNKKLQVSLKTDESFGTSKEAEPIKKILARHDIFSGPDAPSNSILKKEGDTIQMISTTFGKAMIETDAGSFLADVTTFLDEFDKKTDGTHFLRFCIRVSLFFLLPLFLILLIYLIFLILVQTIYSFFLTQNALFVTIVTVILLVILLITGRIGFSHPSSKLTIAEQMEIIVGKREGDRAGAIFSIVEKGIREESEKILSPYIPDIVSMLKDKDPLIRKWGIIFLRKIEYKKASDSLIAALKDSDFDVAYNAARALGSLGSRKAINPLLEILHESSHWYLRLNAYCALKRLGWRQG
ncbi:MAG: HEAT repeat domain-containing protein [bacterium]